MFIGKETELKFLNDKHTDACATSLLCCAAGGVSAKPMVIDEFLYMCRGKQRCTRGYKRYKETSGLIEWKECQIFHSIFT